MFGSGVFCLVHEAISRRMRKRLRNVGGGVENLSRPESENPSTRLAFGNEYSVTQ